MVLLSFIFFFKLPVTGNSLKTSFSRVINSLSVFWIPSLKVLLGMGLCYNVRIRDEMYEICIFFSKIHRGNHEFRTYGPKNLNFYINVFSYSVHEWNLNAKIWHSHKNGYSNPIFTIGGVRGGQTSLLPNKFPFRNPKNPAYLPPLPKILATPLLNTTRILEKNPNFCLKFRPENDTFRAGPARIL